MSPARKAQTVEMIEARLADPDMSLRKACKIAGTSPATYYRWKGQLESAGGDPFLAFAERKPPGRPPAVVFSEDEENICRWYRLSKDSTDVALHFAARDPRLSPEVRQRLLEIEENSLVNESRPNFPPSLRRAFHITAEERAKFRNRKAEHEVEMVTPRGMFWVDEDGTTHDLLPGQLWELDDYSTNQPYTWTDPHTGEFNLGRQVLGAIDYFTAGWLGFDHIGRERDAYRGEDIVRYLGRLFRTHGLPLFLRLERGSWDSSFVHGLKVDGLAQPWGALDHLVTIRHTWKSKGKGLIESSFNPLQTWLSHTGRDVGRFRGEFEAATKAWLRAKRTDRDPRELGFLTADKSADLHAQAAGLMNARPRDRQALGRRIAADDLRAEFGWHTTPFPEAEAWRLLPYRELRVVNAGMVNVTPGGGWPGMSFIVAGVSEHHLANGHKVLVAYDPARPELGAYIANGDTSHRNRERWPLAHPLIPAAPVYQLAPQFDLSGKFQGGAIPQRKQRNAAVATSYRAIVGAGKVGPRESLASNGRDRTARSGSLPEPERGADTTPGAPAPDRGRAPAEPELPAADRLAELQRRQAEAFEHL